MIKEVIKNWTGEVDIDGEVMTSSDAASRIDFNTLQTIKSITLISSDSKAFKHDSSAIQSIDSDETTITVKQYMTQKATPEFDFMAKWNNDIPMPMRTMTGVADKETKGMVHMKLHGFGKPTINCMICQRVLTNPISRHYGIGPICLEKLGIPLDIEDVSGIKEALSKITWEGWIIKSAILCEKRGDEK